MLKTGCA
jgi:hypothetical protein